MSMSLQQANALIETKLQEAKQKIEECEKIADQFGLSFRSPISVYGMGGYYYGKKDRTAEKLQEFLSDNPTATKQQITDFLNNGIDDWESSSEEGWKASSQGC